MTPPEDHFRAEDLPDAVRNALEEYRSLIKRPAVWAPVHPATACGDGRGCPLGFVYRLPSGAVLFIGQRHSPVAENTDDRSDDVRRQDVAAVLTDDGWLTAHGHGFLDLQCAHYDAGFLDPARVRSVVANIARGRRRAGKSIVLSDR